MLIALGVIVLMNYTIYKGLLSTLIINETLKFVLKWVVIFVILVEIVSLASFKNPNVPTWFYIFGISLLGVSFMLFSISVIYEIFYIGVKNIPFDPSRRETIVKILNFSAIGVAFVYVFMGFLGGFRKPRIKKLDVWIKNLQKDLKIVQLSDVHIGKFLKKEYLLDIVKAINAQKADMVVITGDLVDLEIGELKDDLLCLRDLKSTYGTFFVPGNHEYYHGVGDIMEYLEKIGIKVLKNESVKQGGINLAGVYDLAALRTNSKFTPNLSEALQNIDETLPCILLSHQPKFIEEFREDTPVDLMLSGHTHAGQIFPFGLLVKLEQPYLYGLYQHNKNTQIYVSSGAGYWGPPIRFLAPSEIAVINLRPKLENQTHKGNI